ncbi:MAG TPA: hypothetical protein VNM90_11595, partial [Haliangium sp.]|nr:hypothetical protein [Haliangium sp.]
MAAVYELHDARIDLASAVSMPPEIFESWARSRAAGIDPERPGYYRVAEEDLHARLRASHDFVVTARHHMPWVSAFLGDIPHVVVLTDAAGVVLHSIGSDAMREQWRLMPGSDWSEARMGTNGVGTALATGATITIVGEQHYCKELAAITCLAATIVV